MNLVHIKKETGAPATTPSGSPSKAMGFVLPGTAYRAHEGDGSIAFPVDPSRREYGLESGVRVGCCCIGLHERVCRHMAPHAGM